MVKKKIRSASKKSGGSARLGRIVPGDPPIIVGGGGSTLVWINNGVFNAELTAAQVSALLLAHPNIPHPAHPDQYHVFACNFNAVGATVKSDSGVPSVKHNDMDIDRHHTFFHAG